MPKNIHRESFTAEEAFATLVNFEQFIISTYILAARLDDGGHAVVLNPLPGSLIDAWQAALRATEADNG
jgi:hypothetical protein